jgi:hypothetical protein
MIRTIKNCICTAAITSRNSCTTLSVPAFILSVTTACNSANSSQKAGTLVHIIQVFVSVCTYNTHTDCNAHCDLLSVHGVWVGENSVLFRFQKLTVVHHTPSSSFTSSVIKDQLINIQLFTITIFFFKTCKSKHNLTYTMDLPK